MGAGVAQTHQGVAATAPLFSMTTLNNCQWGREGPINTPHNRPGMHCRATAAGHWVTHVPTPSRAPGLWAGGRVGIVLAVNEGLEPPPPAAPQGGSGSRQGRARPPAPIKGINGAA